MLSSTIVCNQDEMPEVVGVANQLDIKREGPFLSWEDGTKVRLPEPLLQVLLIAARAMAHNQGMTLVLRSEWLTTREAAELIGCSRQQVVDLIEAKKLKASKVGTHRRIQLSDLLAFIEAEDKHRDRAMADLIDLTEEMGGYDQEWQEKPGKGKESL